MNKLKETILKDYTVNVTAYVKELIKKGYLKTPDNEILKLNVFDVEFDSVNIESMIDLIDANVGNLWNIPPETQNELISDIVYDLLPVADISECNNYIKYLILKSKVRNPKDLDNDVKALIKKNEKRHKKVFDGGVNSPEYQAQALINENVFYNESDKSYYVFDDKAKKFNKLNADDIRKYLLKYYPNLSASKYDVMDYMKVNYIFFVTKTTLPTAYNINKSYLIKLDEIKDDYDKLNGIVSKFR